MPMRLPPDKVTTILDLLRVGNRRKVAAAMAGITEYRLKQWMTHSQVFRDQVAKAEAEAETEMVQTLFIQGKSSWQSALTWLERRQPADWGRIERLEVAHKVEEIRRLQEELDAEGIPHPPFSQMIEDFEALQRGRKKSGKKSLPSAMKALPAGQ